MAVSNELKINISLDNSELQQAIRGAEVIAKKLPKNIFGKLLSCLLRFLFCAFLKRAISGNVTTTAAGNLVIKIRCRWALKLFAAARGTK
jgi:hypothetical protein